MPYDPLRHGPRRVVGPGFHAQVCEVVHRIPPGCVATYGDVAAALGLASAARQVGYALAALEPGSSVPWHRVVNAQGRISARSDGSPSTEQKRCLQKEGVAVDASGRVVKFAALRCPPPPR